MNTEKEVTKEMLWESELETRRSPDQHVDEKPESDLPEQVTSELLENDVDKYCESQEEARDEYWYRVENSFEWPADAGVYFVANYIKSSQLQKSPSIFDIRHFIIQDKTHQRRW